jgi:hypothetical protein
MRQHEAVVQRVPQRTKLALSCGSRQNQAISARISSCWASAHARIRRHLEAAELDQPEPPVGPSGE